MKAYCLSLLWPTAFHCESLLPFNFVAYCLSLLCPTAFHLCVPLPFIHLCVLLSFTCVSYCLSLIVQCLCLVFPLPFTVSSLPFPCVFTAVLLTFRCLVLVPFQWLEWLLRNNLAGQQHCLSHVHTLFLFPLPIAAKTLPLPCVFSLPSRLRHCLCLVIPLLCLLLHDTAFHLCSADIGNDPTRHDDATRRRLKNTYHPLSLPVPCVFVSSLPFPCIFTAVSL